MNIGDLVRYRDEDGEDIPGDASYLGLGIVTGFDKDDDPVVWFQCDPQGQEEGGSAFFKWHIRVINEHR